MWGQSALLTLPSGIWLDGKHYRAAALRPLTGEDELFMSALAASVSLPEQATILLARCVTALGSIAPVPTDVIAALPVGDREALLLTLRGLSYGGRMDGVLNCSHCNAKLDLDLHPDQLLLPPYDQPAPVYELTVEGVTVAFRLPTGEDETLAARLPIDHAEADLLRRCLVDVTPERAELSEALIDAVEQAMLDCDPQAEIVIDMHCPECGQAFSALFDTAQFLLREVGQRARQLYHDIHTLALTYHWREADILALPFQRRQMYLNLLDEGGTL
ncbi:MAG: hypothetical protein IAE80_14270 [Anaerolinea sp.]|nr:hypothetical protein [Anaerolinea sp.]